MPRALDGLEFGRRAAVDLRPESYNSETDTVKVTWFTNPEAIEQTKSGEKYRCILGTDPAKVDLSFANAGQPIPFGHQRWEGVVCPDDEAYIAQGMRDSFTFDGTRGDCEIKLSSLECDKPKTDKVRNGMFHAVSLEWEPTDAGRDLMTVEYPVEGSRELPTVRVPEWRLRTIVIVPFGADEGAGVRSHATPKEATMPAPIEGLPPVVPAPVPVKPVVDLGARNAVILDLGRRAKLPQTDIDEMILAGEDLDEGGAREAILTKWAGQQKGEPETVGGVRVKVSLDEADTQVKGLASAIGMRMFGGELEPEAQGYRGSDAAGLIGSLMELGGTSVRGMTKQEIANEVLHGVRTHSTLDFSNVFSNLLNRRLVPEREMSKDYDWWKMIASRQDFADYLPVTYVDIGAINNLPHVKEGAEYIRATFGDAAEQIFCLKYGVELGLTEEMIVNDRLSAFARLVRSFIRASALSESALAATTISSNPTMNADGKALFTTGAWDWKRNPTTGVFYNAGGHANLAGSGAVVSPTTLNDADVALRTQVGIDGIQCGQPSRCLLASASKRFGIEQLFSEHYKPTAKENAVTVDIAKEHRHYPPQFTGNAWYVGTGDPLAMEFGYLVGEGGPVVQRYPEPKRDALIFHARDVFGIKVLDPRAFFCNPGA